MDFRIGYGCRLLDKFRLWNRIQGFGMPINLTMDLGSWKGYRMWIWVQEWEWVQDVEMCKGYSDGYRTGYRL